MQLDEYTCNKAETTDPSRASIHSRTSSGTSYPIEKHVSYNNLSNAYRSFLAYLDNTYASRSNMEAGRDP